MLPSSSTCTLWIWPKNIMFRFNIMWQPECQLGRPLISWVNTFRRTNTVVPWPVLFLLKRWWPVLWVDWWSAGRIITSVDHQLLSGGFQGEDTGSNSPQGPLWVSLYGWHLCDLSPWIREAGMVLGWCPPEHYIHHGNGERWPSSIPWHSAFAIVNGLLDHKVYRKTSNTDCWLNSSFCFHPLSCTPFSSA